MSDTPKPITPPPKVKKPFTNPYEKFDACSESQMLCFVDPADKDLLRTIRTGAQGTFTITMGLLVQQLCNELRQRQITDAANREQYESFLTNMRIVDADEYEGLLNDAIQHAQRTAATGGLCDSTAGRSVGMPVGPDDKGTTESESPRMAERPSKLRVVASKVKRSKTNNTKG